MFLTKGTRFYRAISARRLSSCLLFYDKKKLMQGFFAEFIYFLLTVFANFKSIAITIEEPTETILTEPPRPHYQFTVLSSHQVYIGMSNIKSIRSREVGEIQFARSDYK